MQTTLTRSDVDGAMRKMPDADVILAKYPFIPASLVPDTLDARQALDVARALVRAHVINLHVTLDKHGTGFEVESQTCDELTHHVTFDYREMRWHCDCKAMQYGNVYTCVHCQTVRLRAHRSHDTRAYRVVAHAWRTTTRRLARLTA